MSIRVDALSENNVSNIGADDRVKVEKRLRTLDGGVALPPASKQIAPVGLLLLLLLLRARAVLLNSSLLHRQPASFKVGGHLAPQYNAAADSTLATDADADADHKESHKEKHKKKKDKSKKKEKRPREDDSDNEAAAVADETNDNADNADDADDDAKTKKKHKKKHKSSSATADE